jgi:drug/metabolite transporter (DMT)-like permease
MTRPAETIQAIIAAIIGAIVVIQGVLDDGFQLDDVQTIVGAVMVVVGLVAPVVTWIIARRQRDPTDNLTSGTDGTVQPAA